MKVFYEYEKAVMENINFDLVRKDKYHYNDKKNSVWVECDHQDHLLIGFVDKGNELNVKNTKKYVEVSIRERLGEKYLNIDFDIISGNRYECACVSLRRGDAGLLSIYDIAYWRYNHSTEPVATFTDNDFKLIIRNLKLKNYRKTEVSVSEFTTLDFVNAVCDVVRNIHDSKEWNEEINSLLELIKPVLFISGEGIKESWLRRSKVILEHSQRLIDAIDSKIEELQQERLREVDEYNYYQQIRDTLQNSKEEKENKSKK